MKYSWLLFSLLGALLLTSCGGSGAEDYAEDLCDCMEESGYTDEVGAGILNFKGSNSAMRKAQKEMEACAIPILKEMKADLKDMDDDEKKEFFKEFVKASIDTECSDQLMDNIPWMLVMRGLKSLIESDRDMDFFGEEEEMKEVSKDEDYYEF